MGGLLTVVLIVGVVGFFIAIGIAIASTFCKKREEMYVFGICLGLGLLCAVAGIIYAGCSSMTRGL